MTFKNQQTQREFKYKNCIFAMRFDGLHCDYCHLHNCSTFFFIIELPRNTFLWHQDDVEIYKMYFTKSFIPKEMNCRY